MVWLPFELHPEVPREGMPVERAFPPGYLERANAGMQAMAAEVGLVMRRSGRLINSRLALALAELARERDLFEEVHRALFKAHWEGVARLDSVRDLQGIGAEHGLDPAEIEAALSDGRYEELIDANRREALGVGIDAIPAHVFGRRYLVVGAHPYELLAQVVGKARAG